VIIRENLSVTTGGQYGYDNSGWCNKSHKLEPSDLVLNNWTGLQGIYWTACLASEVPEGDLAEEGSFKSLVFLPRWHRVIIP
jgi:hypothetical protein